MGAYHSRCFMLRAIAMNALRLISAGLVFFAAGCTHFQRVPVSKTAAGHTLKVSHTRMCEGDSSPIEVQFTPPDALKYAVINEAGEAVMTGVTSEKFEVSVKLLPKNRYTLAVALSETELVDANFEVALCSYR